MNRVIRSIFDFAGKKLKYHDIQNNQDIEVEFYAGLLAYSQLSFACVVPSQCSEDFLHASRRMLEYFGGTTRVIVTDNLKSGVTKASSYEPEIAQAFNDFCNHYQMVAIPTRARKPKDKPLVEGIIRILYSRIYAPLRNKTFYSLNEITLAISALLESITIHPSADWIKADDRFLSRKKLDALIIFSPSAFIRLTTQACIISYSCRIRQVFSNLIIHTPALWTP